MVSKFPFRLGRRGEKQRIGKENDQSADLNYIGSSEHFRWLAASGIDSVKGIDWVEKRGVPFLEKAYSVYRDKILKIGDLRKLPARVIVKPSLECRGGISGGTANGELGYCAGIWQENQFCYGILAHELCNAFTGECVSGNWPVEWWANHRSPFPTVAANEAMSHLVPQFYEQWGDYNDPLVRMFSFLFKKFDSLFPRMMQKMQDQGISLEQVADPYLSHIVYYFLLYGAGRNVGRYFVSPPMPSIDYPLLEKLEARFRLGVLDLPA